MEIISLKIKINNNGMFPVLVIAIVLILIIILTRKSPTSSNSSPFDGTIPNSMNSYVLSSGSNPTQTKSLTNKKGDVFSIDQDVGNVQIKDKNGNKLWSLKGYETADPNFLPGAYSYLMWIGGTDNHFAFQLYGTLSPTSTSTYPARINFKLSYDVHKYTLPITMLLQDNSNLIIYDANKNIYFQS